VFVQFDAKSLVGPLPLAHTQPLLKDPFSDLIVVKGFRLFLSTLRAA
jgi:hypothetical protein